MSKNGGKEWIVKKVKPFITNTNLNTRMWTRLTIQYKHKIKYTDLMVDDEAYHSAHDDAKKNPQQLRLVQPEKTHDLPKNGKCDTFLLT